MNFLAHYVLATQSVTPRKPLSAYVLGTALPDLLPLAENRARLRSAQVAPAEAETPFKAALAAGVLVHLASDTAFHKTAAFAEASAEVSQLLALAEFKNMRVRRFFVAHVLTELVLDAALLRAGPTLAERFYGAIAAADFEMASRWTEAVTAKSLPHLPHVLRRFADAQYLRHYAEDDGVAMGLSNLCRRAGQDTFEGENFSRLVGVAAQAAEQMPKFVPALLSETAAGILLGRQELRGISANAFPSPQRKTGRK